MHPPKTLRPPSPQTLVNVEPSESVFVAQKDCFWRKFPLEDLEHVRAFVAAREWKFARTMPWLPHWYVVREKCDEDQFVAFVKFIRERGVPRQFGKRTFVYFDLDGFTYWTMGNLLAETTVINRAKLRRGSV